MLRAFEQFSFWSVMVFNALFAFLYAPEDSTEFAFGILLFCIFMVTQGASELASWVRLQKGLTIGPHTWRTVLCALILALAVAMVNVYSPEPKVSAIKWGVLACAALSVYLYDSRLDQTASAPRKRSSKRKRSGKRLRRPKVTPDQSRA